MAFLTSVASLASAQSVAPYIGLAGTFSETGLGLPLAKTGGDLRLGGNLTAGIELVGFPARPWHFDLAGRYQVLPASGDLGVATLGPEFRVGYALDLGRIVDIDPLLGVALAYPLEGTSAARVLLSSGFKLNMYLGAWSWVSLIPQFSYSFGASDPFRLDLGFGFKQLLAWKKSSPHPASEPVPATIPVTIPVSIPQTIPETIARESPSVEPTPDQRSLSVAIETTPALFSPDADGRDDVLTIIPRIDRPQSVRTWEISIDDVGGHRFFSRSGQGAPPTSLIWDGISADGELVESAADYRLSLTVTTDETDGRAQAFADISTDVLVIREGERFKIRVPSILFSADSAQLSPSSAEAFMNQNFQVLNRLTAIFLRFPEYRITIEGHANLVNWNNPVLAAIEERDSSGPLSLQRAQTVMNALVQLGVKPDRLKVVGRGGQNPLVPAGDSENNWKNRRVEIFLDR